MSLTKLLIDFLKSWTNKIALLVLKIYRFFISPFTGGQCRFEPSCSVYAENAFHVHSPLYAFYLTIKRLARCHPWGGQGYDPVPKTFRKETENGH